MMGSKAPSSPISEWLRLDLNQRFLMAEGPKSSAKLKQVVPELCVTQLCKILFDLQSGFQVYP